MYVPGERILLDLCLQRCSTREGQCISVHSCFMLICIFGRWAFTQHLHSILFHILTVVSDIFSHIAWCFPYPSLRELHALFVLSVRIQPLGAPKGVLTGRDLWARVDPGQQQTSALCCLFSSILLQPFGLLCCQGLQWVCFLTGAGQSYPASLWKMLPH